MADQNVAALLVTLINRINTSEADRQSEMVAMQAAIHSNFGILETAVGNRLEQMDTRITGNATLIASTLASMSAVNAARVQTPIHVSAAIPVPADAVAPPAQQDPWAGASLGVPAGPTGPGPSRVMSMVSMNESMKAKDFVQIDKLTGSSA
jgi:hypothetical protein